MIFRSARLCATLAAMALCGAASAAPELWNGAQAGMTPAEVQIAFPKAASGKRTVEGDEMILRVSSLRAGGHDATAYFDFTGERLRTVELSLGPNRSGGNVDAEDVKAQLTAKYGPPTDCDEARETCDWRGGEVDVAMIATGAAAGRNVEVIYGLLAPAQTSAPAGAPSPVELVRAFYGHLATGDGEEASRLVIPAKRAAGPFSAEAMTRFYGALAEPIRLTSAYGRGGGAVFVRYRFTARGGRACEGAADVRTAFVGERRLIEAIHSYSGC